MQLTRTEPLAKRGHPIPPWSTERLRSLYDSESTGTIRLAYVLTGDLHTAQDISQEAFVKVGRKIFGLRDPQHARAYLYRTVLNLCRGRARRLKTERAALRKIAPSQSERSPDIPQQDEMWRALLSLPLRQRTALFLRYYEDLSEVQAAEALQCSVGAIKSLVNRGLNELRQRYEGGSHD